MKDVNSLSHTSWNCKYHIVFAPKYRRRVFYGQKRREIVAILRQLCEWKNVEIIEAEVCPDHVHMLVAIPPKISVASFVGFLKGKSSLLIYQKWANMKFKYRNREFWCRGYYVDTVTYFYGHFDKFCQCEYGEARSAAVAAAISELESRERLQYFIDEKYFPNKHVFRKVFAVLQSVHNLQY